MEKSFESIKNAKRVVVKVGTTTLTHENGSANLRIIERLARVLSDLKNGGREIILVTSGAIGVGLGKLKIKGRLGTTEENQAASAVGQCVLMNIYERFFSEYGHMVAQTLLTKDVMDCGRREKNAAQTFNTLLNWGIIPIVNENDAISSEEVNMELFGDNDNLSAMVSVLIKAELLIILSDIDGLYDANPREFPGAKRIPLVSEIDEEILKSAGPNGTALGRGGMVTKLAAAERVTKNGIDMVIASGARPEILYDILDGKPVGTLFVKKARG